MNHVFATVNMERVLSETQEGKRVIEEIRGREEPKKKEYQQLVNEIVDLRNRYQNTMSALKPEEALRLRQSIEQKEFTAMRFQETTLRDLENNRLDTMAEFEKKVFPVIDQMAKEKGITLLFPYPQRWVIYADPKIDLTDEVITAIDRQVKPGSTPLRATKPQGGGTEPGGSSGGRPKGNLKV